MPGKHIFKWFLWSETLIVKTDYTNAVCFDDLSRAQFGPDKAEATVGTPVSLPALRGRRTAPTRSPLTSTVIINLVNYACAAYSALVLPRYRSTDHMYITCKIGTATRYSQTTRFRLYLGPSSVGTFLSYPSQFPKRSLIGLRPKGQFL